MQRALLFVFLTIVTLVVMFVSLHMWSGVNNIFYVQPKFHSFTPEAQKEIRCLAENIWFEAANESSEGQLAVAFVTINRTKHREFPSQICEVVTQKVKTTCQFSWFCQEREKRLFLTSVSHRENPIYDRILEIAAMVYLNYDKIDDPTEGAIFYHADYVNPKWKNVVHTKTIGRHIFYVLKERNV